MNGNLNRDNFNSIRWADAEIGQINISHDEIIIDLRFSRGERGRIVCEGHIGYSVAGLWDDITIEKAKLIDSSDPFLDLCISEVDARSKAGALRSGNEARNQHRFQLLKILLIDGCVLKIVFSRLLVE